MHYIYIAARHPWFFTMDKFNRVFLAIKKYSARQKLIAEINNFEAIARESEVSLDRLPIYLDFLQDKGLIKYSLEQRYIHLTSAGALQENVAVATRMMS